MYDELSRNVSASLAASLASAYLSRHTVAVDELPNLIETIYGAIAGLGTEKADEPAVLTPAVPVSKSVFQDYIVCLDDGKKFKSLKRHLATLGMTPDEYRAKWSLPHGYPMVAPLYSQKRSQLAKDIGLGKNR